MRSSAQIFLIVLMLMGWGYAHRGGPPALLDAPLGNYRVTYFDDMHVGLPEAVILLSGKNLADVALTLTLTSPTGEIRETNAERVGETDDYVFVVRSKVAEAGNWRARITLSSPTGVAVREVVVSTQGRFAGFWSDAAPSLGVALSLILSFALVWRFTVRTPRSHPPLEVL